MTSAKHFLSLNEVSKFFGDVKAVDDISIDIKQGELVSFIGPSGCGKTTLLRTVGGFYQQDKGTITLDQERIDHLPPEKRLTGMVFQNYALFPHMSVYKNVEYGLRIQKLSVKERKEKIEEALAQVQLTGYGERMPSELSGGQQQRVAIARCLVLEPKVLLLDEPLSNLDANLRMIMREEIRRLKDELDLTIIFVTHDQEEALSISDRVIVLKDGTIQQLDEPENVYRHPANEFVAKFVGHANLLTGSIEYKNDQAYFTSKDIQFKVDQLPEKNHEEVKVMIRPEQININEESPIKAEITSDIYNGNYIRYYTKVGEASIIVDVFNVDYANRFRRGDQIGLEFLTTPHYIEA